jgi:hypothetical protein
MLAIVGAVTTYLLTVDKATKRHRRTKLQIQELRDAIYAIVQEQQPMTVRQLYYQMVVRGLIQKTDAEYHNVCIRLAGLMRRDGTMPWHWIIDESRHMRVPQTFTNIQDALEEAARSYRRSAMDECSKVYIEIWLEKNALAGTVQEVTWDYDVPLLPSVGFSSLTLLDGTARATRDAWNRGRNTYIYQFGDSDPSGVLIPEVMDERLREMCENLGCGPPRVERVALLREHIWQYGLPTHPTKTFDDGKGNRHAKNFRGDSVELDALRPDILRSMVRNVILRHMKQKDVDALRAKEDRERAILRTMRPAQARKSGPGRKGRKKPTKSTT